MQTRLFSAVYTFTIATLFKAALFPAAATWQEGICKPWQGPMRVDWEDTQ